MANNATSILLQALFNRYSVTQKSYRIAKQMGSEMAHKEQLQSSF